MKSEKYKQERLGYCSTETKCGQEKAVKAMKYKRETKYVRQPTRKGKKHARSTIGIGKCLYTRAGGKTSMVEREEAL